MNRRQAARALRRTARQTKNQRLQELEYMAALQAQDIQDYNQAIQAMIGGASPCSWCEENRIGDCTAPERGGKGCGQWWLRFREDSPVKDALEAVKEGVKDELGIREGEAKPDESENILS